MNAVLHKDKGRQGCSVGRKGGSSRGKSQGRRTHERERGRRKGRKDRMGGKG